MASAPHYYTPAEYAVNAPDGDPLNSDEVASLASILIAVAIEKAVQEERDAIYEEIKHSIPDNYHRYTKREALTVIANRRTVA